MTPKAINQSIIWQTYYQSTWKKKKKKTLKLLQAQAKKLFGSCHIARVMERGKIRQDSDILRSRNIHHGQEALGSIREMRSNQERADELSSAGKQADRQTRQSIRSLPA